METSFLSAVLDNTRIHAWLYTYRARFPQGKVAIAFEYGLDYPAPNLTNQRGDSRRVYALAEIEVVGGDTLISLDSIGAMLHL